MISPTVSFLLVSGNISEIFVFLKVLHSHQRFGLGRGGTPISLQRTRLWRRGYNNWYSEFHR